MLKGLGGTDRLVMGGRQAAASERGQFRMAHEEPLLDNPPTQEAAVHVRDYTRFIRLLKWGAIISFITAMLVVVIISN